MAYVLMIISALAFFASFAQHVSADNHDKEVVYRNMELYSVDNEHNAIKIRYHDHSSEPETIYDVPMRVRKDMSDLFQQGQGAMQDKRFDIAVADNNKFEYIKYMSEKEVTKEKNTDLLVTIVSIGIVMVVVFLWGTFSH